MTKGWHLTVKRAVLTSPHHIHQGSYVRMSEPTSWQQSSREGNSCTSAESATSRGCHHSSSLVNQPCQGSLRAGAEPMALPSTPPIAAHNSLDEAAKSQTTTEQKFAQASNDLRGVTPSARQSRRAQNPSLRQRSSSVSPIRKSSRTSQTSKGRGSKQTTPLARGTPLSRSPSKRRMTRAESSLLSSSKRTTIRKREERHERHRTQQPKRSSDSDSRHKAGSHNAPQTPQSLNFGHEQKATGLNDAAARSREQEEKDTFVLGGNWNCKPN